MTHQEAIKLAREALGKSVFAMEMNKWEWNSEASNDMKRESYKLNKQAIAALDAVMINHPLTERKMQSVIERGYKVTGYTLTNEQGQKCIVDMSAVRWFDKNHDFMRMMNAEAANEIESLRQRLAECQREQGRIANEGLVPMTKRVLELEQQLEAAKQKFAGLEAQYERDLGHVIDKLEAYKIDAKRYRWLRETLHSAVGGGVEVNDQRLVYEEPEPNEEVRVYWYPSTPVGFYESKAMTLDRAIDAARKEPTC
jgi:hypothetical protein